MPGSKISRAPGKDGFAVSFMGLELRREQELAWRWEKAGQGNLCDWNVDSYRGVLTPCRDLRVDRACLRQ